MLRSLRIANFTAFAEADLRFSRGLNVIVGENGVGKTHLLKLPYVEQDERSWREPLCA